MFIHFGFILKYIFQRINHQADLIVSFNTTHCLDDAKHEYAYIQANIQQNQNKLEMDFEQLFRFLPKPSITWTVSEIQIWLKFIGLENYCDEFKVASVDGSCLAELTEDDIRNQLKIESKIITKKIMTWITQGIKNYDAFLQKKKFEEKDIWGIKSSNKLSYKEKEMEKAQKMKQSEKFLEFNDFRQSTSQKKQKKRESTETQKQKKEINELIIKQCESTVFNCFSLKEQGGMIGRNSKNEIHIVDENVSRFHAQIQYENNEYFIRDFGSSSGTFMRITEKTILFHGVIVEMGSNQFYVDIRDQNHITFKIIEGPNVGDPLTFQNIGKINVGRKNTNQISFPEDQHLSNIHSTIYIIEGVWYIEDLGTTNGTWIRLSPEGVKSQKFLLENQTQFKLGSSLTYQCQLSNSNRKTEKEKSDKCCFCKISERDCIFIPCKHNLCCFKCSQANELILCNSCGSAITDIMKIYKV